MLTYFISMHRKINKHIKKMEIIPLLADMSQYTNKKK
jgi:hypothetical protein